MRDDEIIDAEFRVAGSAWPKPRIDWLKVWDVIRWTRFWFLVTSALIGALIALLTAPRDHAADTAAAPGEQVVEGLHAEASSR
ncbi:MAG: hypothetical protein ACOY4K_00605 [Pseudomonadota bacterium]